MVMNVPYTRMNEAMRMVQRIGGKITGMNVHGGDLAAAKAAPRPQEGEEEGRPGLIQPSNVGHTGAPGAPFLLRRQLQAQWYRSQRWTGGLGQQRPNRDDRLLTEPHHHFSQGQEYSGQS